MKALLLGGTGTMGVQLSKRLVDKGWDVHITSRSGGNIPEGAVAVIGNARQEDFLRELKKQRWDVVVDFLIYSSSEFFHKKKLLLSLGTHYIFLSSARVFAESKTPICERSDKLYDVVIDEKYLATDEYALSKAKQERTLNESDQKNWTIVRPYITYGDDRLQLGAFEKENWLYRALKGRDIVFCKELEQRKTTLTYTGDVADCLVRIAGDVRTFGDDYNVVTSESITWGEVLNIYLYVLDEHLGYRPNVTYVNVEEFFRCHYSAWQLKYDRFFDRTFDNKKVVDQLKVENFNKVESQLSQCLTAFLEDLNFRKLSWRFEGRRDRLSGQCAELPDIRSFRDKALYLSSRYLRL